MSTLLRQGKRRRMVKFMIGELSAVDLPAQEDARAVILKRADADDAEKSYDEERAVVLLTSAEGGHTHAVWIHPGMRGGETSYGQDPGEESSHDHPWILDGTGRIMIGENVGHDHTVDEQQLFEIIMTQKAQRPALVSSAKLWDDYMVKFTQEDDMPDKPTQEQLDAVKALADRATEAEAKAARATKVSELTDAQKAHFGTLDEAGQDEYLGKTATEREAVIQKAQVDDPVVYTDGNGDEFHKSDDPRLVKMAKERDADRKRVAKVEAERANDSFLKRAETELPNLPGDVKVRAAIVKALDAIEDEDTRKAAHESIKAGDTAIKAAFATIGERGSPTNVGDAEAELDRLAKALSEKDGIDYYDAYDKVSQSNPELAKRAIDGN